MEDVMVKPSGQDKPRRGKILLGIVLALVALAGYAGVIIRIGWFD